VHYSAGLAGLTAVGGATVLPGSGALWLTSRLLLDGAGALFGLYLLTILALFLSGYVLRLRQEGPAVAGWAVRETATRETAAVQAARP
jgi:hypothetical protein